MESNKSFQKKGSVIHFQVSSSLMFCGNDGLFHTHQQKLFISRTDVWIFDDISSIDIDFDMKIIHEVFEYNVASNHLSFLFVKYQDQIH